MAVAETKIAMVPLTGSSVQDVLDERGTLESGECVSRSETVPEKKCHWEFQGLKGCCLIATTILSINPLLL